MRKMLHSVLGTQYEVMFGLRKELDIHDDYMGECRTYAKQILICTDMGDCTVEELKVKVQEIIAHEFLHAYLNEAGVDIDNCTEENVCDFYMKNWRKLNDSILFMIKASGFEK